jgi:flagellin
MSFSLATNISASVAHTNALMVNKNLSNSLEKLSSGYKINKAGDDASGMAIADSLRTQSKSLGQAIRNANDAIGIIQIADKAMDEQIKILDTIKVKAVQSAQDGQTTRTRAALQADITRLMEELDNIASTTTFNGKSLLAGGFNGAKFQIGAYSNTTIDTSIGATSSDKIGHTRFETGQNIKEPSVPILTFKAVDGRNDVTIESVIISHSIGTGIGVLAEAINKNANELRVKAAWNVQSTGKYVVKPKNNINDIIGLKLNGTVIGTINSVSENDSDGKIVAAINDITFQTGVRANIDPRGHLELTSIDGRGIKVEATSGFDLLGLEPAGSIEHTNYGRLTLIRNDARDIIVSDDESMNTPKKDVANKIGFGNTDETKAAEATIGLRTARGTFSYIQADAMGAYTNKYSLSRLQGITKNPADTDNLAGMSAGVTTFSGAQAVMDIADTSIKSLDKIRSDLGSVQIQLEATVNNISVTKTNVQFSESQIRDTDFAEETGNFKKGNILAQAGSYALAQSSSVLQNITRLLQ